MFAKFPSYIEQENEIESNILVELPGYVVDDEEDTIITSSVTSIK